MEKLTKEQIERVRAAYANVQVHGVDEEEAKDVAAELAMDISDICDMALLSREFAEALYGSFAERAALGEYGERGLGYQCAHCDVEIDIAHWTTAVHADDCIINKAKATLSATPPAEGQGELNAAPCGNGGQLLSQTPSQEGPADEHCHEVAAPCNMPFERVPEHAHDPGFGPVPPRSNVIGLFQQQPCCTQYETCKITHCVPRAIHLGIEPTTASGQGEQSCGHHISLLVKSVESAAQWCELCDMRKQRNDAVEMERVYQGAIKKMLDEARKSGEFHPCHEQAEALLSPIDKPGNSELETLRQRVCDLENALGAPPFEDQIGWHNTKYGTFFALGELADTERTKEMLLSDEVIRVYKRLPYTWADPIPSGQSEQAHEHLWRDKWRDGRCIGQECACGTERDVFAAGNQTFPTPAAQAGGLEDELADIAGDPRVCVQVPMVPAYGTPIPGARVIPPEWAGSKSRQEDANAEYLAAQRKESELLAKELERRANLYTDPDPFWRRVIEALRRPSGGKA